MTQVLNKNQQIKVVFKNQEGDQKELTLTVSQLISSTEDDLYEILESSVPCSCSPNESVNFCECEPNYEDFTISHLIVI